MLRKNWLSNLIVAGVLLSIPTAGLLNAQDMPAEFTNLQVFDPEIEVEELKEIMNGFTDQLGVKCTFCHILNEYEKDEIEDNTHKIQARRMIRLTQYLNENAGLYFEEDVDLELLTCGTCHRGEAEVEVFSADDDDDWI